MASVKAMLEEVDGLVTDAKAPVTYRSLSRKLSVSSDIAKRLLAQYARTKGAGVLPLYCVVGRPKCSCNAYSVQLVPGDALDAAKHNLEQVTSTHIYSIQSQLPKDDTSLWHVDHEGHQQDFGEALGVDNPLRDNRWSRLQFQATRTARTVPHVVAAAAPLPAAITKTKKSTIQPKSKQDSAAAPQGVLGKKQPGQQGAQRKTAVASARVGSKQSKLSKPAPKKQQSGLSSFFKAASKKLATIPSNPAASVPKIQKQQEEQEEGEDDDDDDEELSMGKRHTSGARGGSRQQRRRICDDSSDSESDNDAEEMERELAMESAFSDEQERKELEIDTGAAAVDDCEGAGAVDTVGEMTATQEPPQASECPGTEPAPKSAATKTVRTKKTRTFMNKKGFIDTEEYWSEEEVQVGDGAAATTTTSQPKAPKTAAVVPPARKKKKTGKATGSRDIMSFFK